MSRPQRFRSGTSGFTLIEILVVVSIISLLAGLVLVGVLRARIRAQEAMTQTRVANWTSAVERYVQDEGDYPGRGLDVDPESNHFPLLYRALCGQRRPKGPAGRSAPYIQPRHEDVVVLDVTTGAYRRATRGELRDDEIDKFVVDAWGEPLIYRCNAGRDISESSSMVRSTFDLYSKGADNDDQTMLGGEGDDIGNW